MKFSIFDHMDRGSSPLNEQFEQRLKLAEAYEAAGFYAYHLAEHHSTPLGIASAPSVFLSAIAQRTKRLRFGPLVYALSMHHPIRVLEEICMLDQMSSGRLELGFGRGISPFEIGYYGVNPDSAQEIYQESYQIIQMGLTHKEINFHGKHFQFNDVPVELSCFQKPTPPIWYGLGSTGGTKWAAENRINVVCNGPAAFVRRLTDSYRNDWHAAGHSEHEIPEMGVSRHVVVADTDSEALEIAERGYQKWRSSLFHLWIKHGTTPTLPFPPTFAGAQEAGLAIAGAPDTVREWVRKDVLASGVNYMTCRMAFGDMTYEESLHSTRLFGRQIAALKDELSAEFSRA
ncbi:Flavin-dependent oxidoreductase, luciferase family (includes alkanesulfonate monooxygenase SsuD and methylene tetrahydromethanopterin reductase) [Variovorax sp. YR266]|uniref:LLM class flavin-dependent oxidoreductase n=1 Tax=Variovorax sp. YR266 TaxID=1884386 RepID=UPI0008954E98|nr:LLM class flavin-dependent oxidoreductase [Variovorax sp. YR266]SDY35024.1 Flavin-dependent oxidoreductase, luciferase family (includes alkanesulfonate monooxygenase SsuD and methylene tetrahydromethanopterin reductase) [Variovorax sp. YR266]